MKKRVDWSLINGLNIPSLSKRKLCMLPLIHQPHLLGDPLFVASVNGMQYVLTKILKLSDWFTATIGTNFLHYYADKHNYTYSMIQITPSHLHCVLLVDRSTLSNRVLGNIRMIIPFTAERMSDIRVVDDDNNDIPMSDTISTGIAVMLAVLNQLALFINNALDSCNHPVKVKSKNAGKTHKMHIKHDKKPWMRGDLASIVFLDQLPTEDDREPKEAKGGTHASPRFHQRKGHYRTLRDERYKDNPDYGKPKYIAPMWIGEDTSEVSGTTYTVLHARKK